MWNEGTLGYFIVASVIAFLGGLMTWLRAGGRKKTKIELDAQAQAVQVQKQSQLSELFEDATALKKYVDDQIAAAVAPLKAKLEASDRLHAAFRTFFTQVFFWDRGGRVGALPLVPDNILAELRLEHFLGLPMEDTEPVIKKE